MEQIHQEHARVFRALCDPKRLAILALLREGEQCACMLMDRLGMGQSAVSYHMKILCDSGVVVGRKEGKWMYYSISEAGADYAKTCIDALTNVSPDATETELCHVG